jgi:regulator of protease activity HflC (stomatin/prohibitin superfamily)
MVLVIIFLLVLFILLVFSASVKIVRQSTAYVVERLGAYSRTLGVGVHLIIPFFDRIAKKANSRETDGKVIKATLEKDKTPATFDSFSLIMCLFILMISTGLCVVLYVKRKRA